MKQPTFKNTIIIGAALMGVGVAIGAFGAHALKDIIVEHDRWETWKTAEFYHFVHALAILLVGVLYHKIEGLQSVVVCFKVGILIFSGSLYVLSLTGINWLGMITPIGGVLFIIGWFILIWKAVKSL